LHQLNLHLQDYIYTHDETTKPNFSLFWNRIDEVKSKIDKLNLEEHDDNVGVNYYQTWTEIKAMLVQLKTISDKIENSFAVPNNPVSAQILQTQFEPQANSILDTLNGKLNATLTREG